MPTARNRGGAGTEPPRSASAQPLAAGDAGAGLGVSLDPASALMDPFALSFAPVPDAGAAEAPPIAGAAASAGGAVGRPDFPLPSTAAVEDATTAADGPATPAPKPPPTAPKRGRGRPPGSKNRRSSKTGPARKSHLDTDGFTPVHRDPDPEPEPEATEAGAKAKAKADEEDGTPTKPPKRTKHKQLINSEGRCRRCLEGPAFKKGHARTCPKSVHYGAPIPSDSSSDEWETDSEADEDDLVDSAATGTAGEWEETGTFGNDAGGAEEGKEDGEGDGKTTGDGEEDGDEAATPSPRRTTPRRAAAVAVSRRDLDKELERRLKQKKRERSKKEGGDGNADENRDDDDLMKEIETLARPSGVEGVDEVLGGKRKRDGGEGDGDDDDADGAKTPPPGKRRKKKKKKRRKRRSVDQDAAAENVAERLLSPLEEYKLTERRREEAVAAAEVAKAEMEAAVSRYEAAKTRIHDLDRQLQSKENAVVDTRLGDESDWSRLYARLQAYKDVHGHILFPLNCYKSEDSDPELRELFQWVMKQRKTARHMAVWRKKALARIGFHYDTHDATWEARFMELAKFHEVHGTCVVQHNHLENPQLGQWVSTQRRMRRNLPKLSPDGGVDADGKKGPKTCVLTPERIARLDALNFVWDAPSTAWGDRFKELLEFKKETGSFNVPNPWPANPPLQRWVQTQRTHYRYYGEGNAKCQLTAERIKMLDDVGFPWRQRPDWRSSYERLVRYKAEYGTSVVSEGYDKGLAKWTRNQRTEYRMMLQGRKNKLKPDHVRLLDEIGFDWIPPTKRLV